MYFNLPAAIIDRFQQEADENKNLKLLRIGYLRISEIVFKTSRTQDPHTLIPSRKRTKALL